MPNRHKLPENLKPEVKKFSYFSKPNWAELKQIERAKRTGSTKKKTINDVTVDPDEVAAIYQLIDQTQERMKQIKEGVTLPKEIGRPSSLAARLNKTEDNIIVEEQKQQEAGNKMPEIASTSKRTTSARNTMKSSYQTTKIIGSSFGHTIIEEGSSAVQQSSTGVKEGSSRRAGGGSKKLHTREPSQDSLVKFRAEDEKSGIRHQHRKSVKYDVMSPKSFSRNKVTFSPETETRVTRKSNMLQASSLGSKEAQSILKPQQRDLMMTPFDERTAVASPEDKKRASVYSHLEHDLFQSGISHLRTTAATKFLDEKRSKTGSPLMKPLSSAKESASLPQSQSPMGQTQLRASKWATSQFSIFVHDTKLAHYQQERQLLKKQWLEEKPVAGEIAEEDKTEEEQATGQFIKNFQREKDVNNVGLPIKKQKIDDYSQSIKKGSVFKEANLVKTISAFAKSTEKLQSLACRGFRNLKTKRENGLLKSDISFKDLMYPNQVDESLLIQKYFSDSSPQPPRVKSTSLKKGAANAESIYSIKREITPQLIAHSPTPESSLLMGVPAHKSAQDSPAVGRSVTHQTRRTSPGNIGQSKADGGFSSATLSKVQRQSTHSQKVIDADLESEVKIPAETQPRSESQGKTLLMGQTSQSETRPLSIGQKTNLSSNHQMMSTQMKMNSSIGEFKIKGMTVKVLARQNNFGFYPSNIGKTLPNELDYREKQILRRKVGDEVKQIKKEVEVEFQKKNLYSGMMDPFQQNICKDILKRNKVHKRFKMHVPNFMRKEREEMLKKKQLKQAQVQAEYDAREHKVSEESRRGLSERKKKRHNFSMTDDELKGVRSNFVEFMKSTVTKDLAVSQKRKTNLDERVNPPSKFSEELNVKFTDRIIDV